MGTRLPIGAVVVAACLALPIHALASAHRLAEPQIPDGEGLSPTAYLPIPTDIDALWIAPAPQATVSSAVSRLATGVKLFHAGNYDAVLPLLAPARNLDGPAASYRSYYIAQANLKLGRLDAARRQFAALAGERSAGYLSEAAMLGEAEAATAAKDHAHARSVYERLLSRSPMAPDRVLLLLGGAARLSGDRSRAVAAFQRVHDEFPLSPYAGEALARLILLQGPEPPAPGSARYLAELRRADRLFEARRFEDARGAFVRLHHRSEGGERDRIELRLAICDFAAKRYTVARAGLRRHLGGSFQAEARFYDLMATRALGAGLEFERLAREFVHRFHGTSWSEETLDALATHYIRGGRDAEADAAFRKLLNAFPAGRFAERAAWKVGWRAYRSGSAREAAAVFDRAAATFARSDYRPAYVYWSARALDAVGEQASATARYALVRTDYLHSYYGGLAHAALAGRAVPASPSIQRLQKHPGGESSAAHPLVATAPLIRLLLSAGLYDDALNEIRFAQHRWGDSPALQATVGLAQHLKGELLAAARTIKRAYPVYLAADGATIPSEMTTVIYPVAYWTQIREHAARHQLDPSLVAAVIAQESGFVADIRSSAKAIGLMQLLPATGGRYARKLGLAGYQEAHLTRPAVNLRLGTVYLADLIRQFGDLHLALASYNAGEGRVRRWLAERPDLAAEVFIEDIPFPETQMYVKKVLGGLANYRRVYAAGVRTMADPDRAVPGVGPTPSGAAAASRGRTSPPGTRGSARARR